uniref:Uncharacterized protein n=1 Tax=Arundo donax TaxID=35708 RepID=A0A0A9FH80_ARUDO
MKQNFTRVMNNFF